MRVGGEGIRCGCGELRRIRGVDGRRRIAFYWNALKIIQGLYSGPLIHTTVVL